MSVNGGYGQPSTVTTIVTNNPNGGQPPATPPAPAPASLTDNVVTTNALGAHTSVNRPIA